MSCVFNAIHESYHEYQRASPQVKHQLYCDNETKIQNAILGLPRPYNPSDMFAITMEKFIETEYEAIVEQQPPETDSLLQNPSEVSLLEKRNEALKSVVDHRKKKEIASINRKYAKYKRNHMNHPNYLNEWLQFYFQHSYKLSVCGVIDEKFYNYIFEFRNYFNKWLNLMQKQEIEELSEKVDFPNELEEISEEEDFDVKLIEETPEIISVTSHSDNNVDDDEVVEEPLSKKQKVIEFFDFLFNCF